MQRCEHIGNLSCIVTLVSSAFTVMGHALNYLDQHGVAFGVIFGFCSLCVTWYYKRKHFKLAAEAIKCESCIRLNQKLTFEE